MQYNDKQEVSRELKIVGNAIRSMFSSLGLFNLILYDGTKDSENFSYTDWKIIENIKEIRENLDEQKSKEPEEFIIVKSNYWIGFFTKK